MKLGTAEDEGFEPSIGFPIHAFQACALGHYANPPRLRQCIPTQVVSQSNLHRDI
jgi:hypothetical protein